MIIRESRFLSVYHQTFARDAFADRVRDPADVGEEGVDQLVGDFPLAAEALEPADGLFGALECLQQTMLPPTRGRRSPSRARR